MKELVDTRTKKISEWLGNGSINIFGWPFSGKDTQGRVLAQLLGASLVGGGEILRNSKVVTTRVREIMDKGQLIPTPDYIKIVTPYLSKPEYANRPIVMSSLGRWHGEEEAITEAAAAANHPIKAVVVLNIDEDISRQRAMAAKELQDRGQRADDADDAVTIRYGEFRNKTLQVIEFYRRKNLLIEIDGSPAPQEVTEDILDKLETFSENA